MRIQGIKMNERPASSQRRLMSLRRIAARAGSAMNHDFCPWANQYVYWLKQPIGWFVLAACAALLIGLVVAKQALVVGAALLVVIGFGVAWPWIGMRGVSCSLSFDRGRAREDSAVRVRVVVDNRWPWPAWGLLITRGFFENTDDLFGASPSVSLARVPGWSQTTFEWDFRPPRRGKYPVEVPRIACGYPFGIWHAQRDIVVENELLVWPRTVALTSIPPIRGRTLSASGAMSRNHGDDGDVLGVRAYRPGDSLRHIHWPQTAKHEALVVCERQTSARRRVRVIFDVDAAAHTHACATDSLEWVVRVGASIIQQFHAHGASIRADIGDSKVLIEPDSRGLKRVFDALAVWSPKESTVNASPVSPGQTAETLIVAITTGAGFEQARRQLANGGELYLIVLEFEGDAGADSASRLPGASDRVDGSATNARCLQLNGHADIFAKLFKGWERVCHDSWSRN
jgi:uncharacterized protein (DUF58 family)